MYMYMVFYEAKVIGLGNIEGPYPGTWNFQGRLFMIMYVPCKNIVMLSCLVWKIRSPIFMYMVLYEAKSHRARNIEGPYAGAWNFHGGARGTMNAPCKNMVMLSCSIRKIRSPHFQAYVLTWNVKSSGSETSKAPTQGPEIFRMRLRGRYTSPVKIYWCYLV